MPSTRTGLAQPKCIEQPDQQARWLDWFSPAKIEKNRQQSRKIEKHRKSATSHNRQFVHPASGRSGRPPGPSGTAPEAPKEHPDSVPGGSKDGQTDAKTPPGTCCEQRSVAEALWTPKTIDFSSIFAPQNDAKNDQIVNVE